MQVRHVRSFCTLSFEMNETFYMSTNRRKVTFSSEKGKEEAADSEVDCSEGESLDPPSPSTVQCLATGRSRFRFRVAGGRWSEAVVSATDDNGTRTLIRCGPEALVWCSVIVGDRQTTLRLSPLGLMENRLPCPLYWAAADGSLSLLAPGEQRPFLGRPEDMTFGL